MLFSQQAIGTRLEELLLEDKQNVDQVIATVSDENKQRDLIIEDEEEDFLDEGDFSRSDENHHERTTKHVRCRFSQHKRLRIAMSDSVAPYSLYSTSGSDSVLTRNLPNVAQVQTSDEGTAATLGKDVQQRGESTMEHGTFVDGPFTDLGSKSSVDRR